MKTSKFIIVMALIAVVTGSAFAQNGNGPRNDQHTKLHQGPANDLELTDSQQEQMKSLRLKMQKETLPISNELGENRARMRTLTTADNADLKAINKLIDKNSELRAKMAKLRAAHHQEVRMLLTDEQRIKFDSRGYHRSNREGDARRQQRPEQGRRMHGQGPE